MSLATQRGQGFAAVGKVIEDIHKEQVAIEDNNTLLELIKTASIDIENASAGASQNTDIKFAINAFDKVTKAEKWNGLTKDKKTKS